MALRTDNLARRPVARITVVVLAASLPLIGLVSLLLRSELDPHFENYRAHFVVFGRRNMPASRLRFPSACW
jgi:hypothetical protein